MANKDDEIWVMAKGAYGISSCVPLSQLEEFTKREQQREREVPFEDFLNKIRQIPLPPGYQRKTKTQGVS